MFSLKHTLESGQFFRWTRRGEGDYAVHTGRALFRARQEGGALRVEGASPEIAREFFSLDHDLTSIDAALRRDPKLRPALDAYPGLRLLRQDPWECTAAFILSIASNIPRIAGNIADLARVYGDLSRLGDVESHEFPGPRAFVDERELRRLKLGFRAAYLVQAGRLAAGGLLEEIEGLPTEEAKDALMVMPGVAEKVADCVLLFAYGRLSAFPVDTWIRKVMTEMHFGGRRVPDRAIRAFAQERWGDLAGYAQQYLYHWSRNAWTPASSRGRRAVSRV
ncbi:MAG TPA: DNA glycosylase [Planctomycetota bacterium]|nr:DNA glycosylase [Planctomycetota bacterium]